jgi:hypothetical protein
MLLIFAFALFALLIAAWVVAPGHAAERHGADPAPRATMPELRTHAA